MLGGYLQRQASCNRDEKSHETHTSVRGRSTSGRACGGRSGRPANHGHSILAVMTTNLPYRLPRGCCLTVRAHIQRPNVIISVGRRPISHVRSPCNSPTIPTHAHPRLIAVGEIDLTTPMMREPTNLPGQDVDHVD